MSQPKNSLAKTKCRLGTRVWVHNLSSSGWTGPKEDWKCNLMCQQKDILHLDSSVQRGAALGGGSLGDPPILPWSFHLLQAGLSPSMGQPAQDPGVGRALAVRGERTKAETAKGTRK